MTLTPKQRAKELYEIFETVFPAQELISFSVKIMAKEAAIRCVREILKEPSYCDSVSTYYQQVEQELKKL